MPLPKRSFYGVLELADQWSATLPQMLGFAMDGELQLSVMTLGVPVQILRFEEGPESLEPHLVAETVLDGPQPVMAGDLWPVVRHGSTRISRFMPPQANQQIRLAPGVQPQLVTREDVVVRRADRERFEVANDLPSDARRGPAEQMTAQQPMPLFIQRNNYADVVINGQPFHLGPIQAQIVRQLHEASGTAHPWVSGRVLLDGAKAETTRLVDLFKKKPRWRDLILSDQQGSYRLNLPLAPISTPTQRAYRRMGWMMTASRKPRAA